MKKGLFSFFIILTILSLAACGGSSGDDDKVTLDPILEEAIELGNFPEDAEVVEMAELYVNGEQITGTDSVELEDTTESEIDVSITLPASLSRNLTRADGLNIWTNGRTTKVPSYNPTIRKADLGLPLEMGGNLFTFYFEDSAGKEYRTVVVKITRIGVALKFELRYATENFASLSTVQSVKFNVKADGYSKSFTRKTSKRNIDIGVPSLNKNLAIAITAYTSTDDTSFVLEYAGAKTVSSVSGTSVNVPVNMVMSKSKLVVPDEYNNRVLVYKSMDDNNPGVIDSETFPASSSPFDVDLDDAGRAYILFSGDIGQVYRYNKISSEPEVMIGASRTMPVSYAISLDSASRRLYVGTDDSIYVLNIDSKTVNIIDCSTIIDTYFQYLRAVESLGSGNLVIGFIDEQNNGNSQVLKVNINSSFELNYDENDYLTFEEIIATGYGEASNIDVIYQSGFLYVCGSSSQIIAKMNTNLNIANISTDVLNLGAHNTLSGYSPVLFVGRGFDDLVYRGEVAAGPTALPDYLISLDDISGAVFDYFELD